MVSDRRRIEALTASRQARFSSSFCDDFNRSPVSVNYYHPPVFGEISSDADFSMDGVIGR
jgi:hypothetical protein